MTTDLTLEDLEGQCRRIPPLARIVGELRADNCPLRKIHDLALRYHQVSERCVSIAMLMPPMHVTPVTQERQAIEEIVEILYGDPDAEWDSSTLSDIEQVLIRRGLGPHTTKGITHGS